MTEVFATLPDGASLNRLGTVQQSGTDAPTNELGQDTDHRHSL